MHHTARLTLNSDARRRTTQVVSVNNPYALLRGFTFWRALARCAHSAMQFEDASRAS